MQRFKRLAATVGAVGLLVSGAAVVAPTAANATGFTYGTMTVSPSGPYNGGEIVTITYAGLDSTVSGTAAGNGGGSFIGYCVGSGNPQAGTGACGPFEGGGAFPSPAGPSSTLITGAWYWFGAPTITPDGSVRLKIPAKGAVAGFADYPTYKCDNTTQCNIVVGDFSGDGPTQVPIVYTADPELACKVVDSGVDPATATYTDSGAAPTAYASAVSRTSAVVGTTPVSVAVSVTTKDDCLGSKAVVANFKNTNGVVKKVTLAKSAAESGKVGADLKLTDVWRGTAKFSNADRGTWSLLSASVSPALGNVVRNNATNAVITDNSTTGAAVTANLAVIRKVAIVAATASYSDGTPEPILLNRTLTVKAKSLKASGTSYVVNGGAPILIQYRPAGSSTWRTLKSTRTYSNGTAAATLKMTKKGTWYTRTITSARTGYASSVSASDAVLVK